MGLKGTRMSILYLFYAWGRGAKMSIFNFFGMGILGCKDEHFFFTFLAWGSKGAKMSIFLNFFGIRGGRCKIDLCFSFLGDGS